MWRLECKRCGYCFEVDEINRFRIYRYDGKHQISWKVYEDIDLCDECCEDLFEGE